MADFIDSETLRRMSDDARAEGGTTVLSGSKRQIEEAFRQGGNQLGFVTVVNPAKGFAQFAGMLASLTNRIRRSDSIVQNKVAYVAAQVYRNSLRRGVPPELSPLTRAVSGEHKALSTLAEHVIVKPATKTRPATVTFEPGWAKIAWLLEVGYVIDVNRFPKVKNRLFWLAKLMTGAQDMGEILDAPGTGGYWVVPARPHQKFLTGARLDKVMEAVARNTIFGTPLPAWVNHLLRNTRQASRGEFRLRDEVPI